MKFTLKLAEWSVTIKENFEGALTTQHRRFTLNKSDSQTPEIGMHSKSTIRWTKLMVRIFSAKCTSFRGLQDQGESGDIAAAVIEGLIQNRRQTISEGRKGNRNRAI